VSETAVNKTEPAYDDEIDLVALIANLWREKAFIIGATIITTLLGGLYAFTATPIYKASTQLTPPSISELSFLNQTEFFNITPELAFSEFIQTVESSAHINNLTASHADLLQAATNIHINDNVFNAIGEARTINYPNTSKKTNDLSPDKYVFSYLGTDRKTLNNLISVDLAMASANTLNLVKKRYKDSLSTQIKKIERQRTLQQQSLEDQLNARKTYVLATRSDSLKRLEEALKIAKILNLKAPSSLARLASSTGNRQVEINAELNTNQDPLYLRGITLLSAEIENLKALEDTIFLDDEIRNLEAQKQLLENNRELEQLNEILTDISLENPVNFYSANINSPSKPVKPKKSLILAISILLGGMLGLFIAIGRIVYKNSKHTKIT